MSQDSLNKIKDAEKEAKSTLDNVQKDVANEVLSEKKKWEKELENIKESSDAKLKIKIKAATKEAEREKIKRLDEIEANVNNIKNNSSDKIDEAVGFVVEEFVSRFK